MFSLCFWFVFYFHYNTRLDWLPTFISLFAFLLQPKLLLLVPTLGTKIMLHFLVPTLGTKTKTPSNFSTLVRSCHVVVMSCGGHDMTTTWPHDMTTTWHDHHMAWPPLDHMTWPPHDMTTTWHDHTKVLKLLGVLVLVPKVGTKKMQHNFNTQGGY